MALVGDICELEYGLGGCKERWKVMLVTTRHRYIDTSEDINTINLCIRTDSIKQYKDVFDSIYYNSVGAKTNLYRSLIGKKRIADKLGKNSLSIGFINYQHLSTYNISADELCLSIAVVDDVERYYSNEIISINQSQLSFEYQCIDQEYYIDFFTWSDFIDYAIRHININDI